MLELKLTPEQLYLVESIIYQRIKDLENRIQENTVQGDLAGARFYKNEKIYIESVLNEIIRQRDKHRNE